VIVRVAGLSKRFPVRRTWGQTLRAPFAAPTADALRDVTFDVREGEIFGLLGRNGAGKTTLFKILSTLLVADAGTASVDGYDVASQGADVREALAPVLANERSLSWRLSARENLRLYAALQGLSRARAEREIERVLGVTGLADTGAKMVGAFSSGMRQRLLIARALLGRPRLLLLDEPTRSLDPLSARDFRRFLRETIVGTEGCTVLLATHDADEVWDLCERVAVLERGRVLAVDNTAALRHRAGSARYDVWLRAADGPTAVARLAAAGHTLLRVDASAEPDWDHYRVSVPDGAEAAARVLAVLTAGGTAVARFERAAPSLADVIEQVLATAGIPTHA
jgi:ABC-2 type transport system ATP-binding protein